MSSDSYNAKIGEFLEFLAFRWVTKPIDHPIRTWFSLYGFPHSHPENASAVGTAKIVTNILKKFSCMQESTHRRLSTYHV
jgi:hypothetical protein